jgi:hypothetical protein
MNFVLPMSLAQLKHMNTRTEMHGDESVIACDLNLEFDATSESVLKQLCLGNWEALNFALFNTAEPERPVRDPSMAPVKFTHKLKEHALKLGIELDRESQNLIVNVCTLKRFMITPQSGEVVRVFVQAQITPKKEDLAIYAQGLEQGKVQIQIDPPAQMELIVNNDKAKQEQAA